MHRRANLSAKILATFLLINWCSCALNPRPEFKQISGRRIDDRQTKKPSGPNDFIGQSLVDPVTKNIFIDPLLARSGESVERQSFEGDSSLILRKNSLLKKIIDNYDPQQGWNFLSQEKIVLVHLAIDEYKIAPTNLRIKRFLQAIVKQLEIPANLYFLEFGDVKQFYDEIVGLNIR